MSSKNRIRIRMALYVLVLVLAELIQTAVFGSLHLGIVPCVMPVAVACISVFEGAEKGSIFGLVGGCIWAWSRELSYYGAWCIVALTLVGILAGIVTERFLLQGIKTALTISAVALVITEGFFTISNIASGQIPFSSLFSTFVPASVIALLFCFAFYPLAAQISRIGGTHG